MVCQRPFLVGAGHFPDHEMRTASNALSQAWGFNLLEYSCSDDPREVMISLPEENGLVMLLGDPAATHCESGSWLEALAAWRKPAVLMVKTELTGELSGTPSAYAALCEILSVPLVGLVQVGGYWNPLHRRLDGLPWCGWIPSKEKTKLSEDVSFSTFQSMKIEEVVLVFRQRISHLTP